MCPGCCVWFLFGILLWQHWALVLMVYMIYRRQRGQINQTKKKKKKSGKLWKLEKSQQATGLKDTLLFFIILHYISIIPQCPASRPAQQWPAFWTLHLLALPFQSHISGQYYAKIPPCCYILQLNLGAVRQKTGIFQGMKHLQNPVPMRYRPRGLVHTQLFVTASVLLCCCENNNEGGRKCYYQHQ